MHFYVNNCCESFNFFSEEQKIFLQFHYFVFFRFRSCLPHKIHLYLIQISVHTIFRSPLYMSPVQTGRGPDSRSRHLTLIHQTNGGQNQARLWSCPVSVPLHIIFLFQILNFSLGYGRNFYWRPSENSSQTRWWKVTTFVDCRCRQEKKTTSFK